MCVQISLVKSGIFKFNPTQAPVTMYCVQLNFTKIQPRKRKKKKSENDSFIPAMYSLGK